MDVRRDIEGGANAVQVLARVAIMVIIFMVF